MSAYDPGCVKTHTSAKCRKHNSLTRHRVVRAQYDLALRVRNCLRCFYARGRRWSFHTTKTHLRHRLWKSRSAAVSSATEGVIFRSEHGRHWNETARLYHAARRRSRGVAAAHPRAARALTGLRRSGGTAGAKRSDLSLAGASRLSACCIGLFPPGTLQ